jgi:hypothetical protein
VGFGSVPALKPHGCRPRCARRPDETRPRSLSDWWLAPRFDRRVFGDLIVHSVSRAPRKVAASRPGLTARNELPTRAPPAGMVHARSVELRGDSGSPAFMSSCQLCLTPCPMPVLRSEGGCSQCSTDSSADSSTGSRPLVRLRISSGFPPITRQRSSPSSTARATGAGRSPFPGSAPIRSQRANIVELDHWGSPPPSSPSRRLRIRTRSHAGGEGVVPSRCRATAQVHTTGIQRAV